MSKPVVWTAPGKVGDTLLQWPIAYQWHRMTGKKFHFWMDEKTCAPLVPLIEAQPCVEEVKLIPGIEHWRLGGQPFDFGLKTEDHLEYEIYHLGLRKFPERQITLQVLEWLPFDIDKDKLAQEPSLVVWDAVDLEVEPRWAVSADAKINTENLYVRPGRIIAVDGPLEPNRLVLHGTFRSHLTGTPSFWRFLNRVKLDLAQRFDEVYFTGTPEERARAMELYGGATDQRAKGVFKAEWKEFDDHGNFLELARLMAGAKMVIGSGSCGVVLAGALKIPSLRVHDPIGDAPKCIWSSLGPLQFNETERDLRELWPYILNQVMDSKSASDVGSLSR